MLLKTLNYKQVTVKKNKLKINNPTPNTEEVSPQTLNVVIRQISVLLRDVTWLSIPSMSSMEKKRMAHSGETGNCVTASGYAKNAKPGPVEETDQ